MWNVSRHGSGEKNKKGTGMEDAWGEKPKWDEEREAKGETFRAGGRNYFLFPCFCGDYLLCSDSDLWGSAG
jgi:hypothetical protein